MSDALPMFPPKEDLTVCFAHAAYQMKACFDAMDTGIASFEVRTPEDFQRRVGEADVVVVSGMWKNDLLPRAEKLRFIQSISAGVNQYDVDALRAHGVRLASAQGVNANAVSEHAMALILAMLRRLPEARDNQARHYWRPMMGDFGKREDELGGKTLLIVGLGRIGGRLAKLARAFDMRVIGVRRDPSAGTNNADSVHALGELPELLPQADLVALTCPLTPETQGLIGAEALGAMKRTAYLDQRRPWRLREGGGTDRGAAPGPHRGRRAGHHGGGTLKREVSALGHEAGLHHLPPGRRDAPVRAERAGNPYAEP